LSIVSGLSDKFLPTFRAADADLSLMAWDTDTLSAMGTAEIAIVPISEALAEIQPFLIFCPPCGNIP
jgi:hypothetical protein